MELDIYDFDKTLVPFDSGSLFIFFCAVRYPWILITEIPCILIFGLLVAFKIIRFTSFKKFCFSFVLLIPLEKAVKKFWDKHEKDIYPWFFSRKRKALVISASPDFLLNEIARRAKFDYLICTRHNAKTGAIIGENCRGREKVRRFKEEFRNVKIVDVYSDSYKHDKYIFSLAGGSCYHIEKGKRIKFDYNKKYGE
ncbi:MAG: haloacid dehalogenase-like hydrolase [Clostridiales bacterium]|nr:haloacid dehalogenase-like hydrolase [Clostridiales bacterium]